MTLISIITALLAELCQPIEYSHRVKQPICGLLDWLERRLNSRTFYDGVIAWSILIVLSLFVVLLIGACLHWIAAPLYSLFSIAVIYWSMGFGKDDHYYQTIYHALRSADIPHARTVLAAWRGVPGDELSAEEIARLSIEKGLIVAYHHLFAVVIFYSLFGLYGALIYRLSMLAAERWQKNAQTDPDSHFHQFAHIVLYYLDWLPIRFIAFTFTLIGNFEDALYCWRSQASSWPKPEQGIILASAAGALGLRLGRPLITEEEEHPIPRPELGFGDEADADMMRAVRSLVWRVLLCYLVLVLSVKLIAL